MTSHLLDVCIRDVYKYAQYISIYIYIYVRTIKEVQRIINEVNKHKIFFTLKKYIF